MFTHETKEAGFTKKVFLAGKRIKPAIGIILPFTLLHAALFNVFSIESVFIAIGFASIYLFADMFNDFYDLHEDLRNERKDKLLISTGMKKRQILHMSYFFLVFGVTLLFGFSAVLGAAGLFLAIAGWAYTHPFVRLKKYEVYGYVLSSTPFFALPFALSSHYGREFSISLALLAVFSYTQYVYILCQKDATDLKDDVNLFLKRSNTVASLITGAFSITASLAILAVAMLSGLQLLLIVWIANLAIKLKNLSGIYSKSIGRGKRFRLTTYEFISHYAFFVAALLAGFV